MSDDQELDFGSAIDQLVADKGISRDKVLETIEAALAAAFRKDFGERGQDIRAEFDDETGKARIYRVVTVTEVPEGEEDVENPAAQISLTEAKKQDKDAEIGKEYVEDVTPDDPHYGRVAAQTAKQVIIQRIREAEREAVFEEYKDKEGEIISGIVQRVDGDRVYVDIGRTTGILPPSEQVYGERHRLNQRIRVYVVKVDNTSQEPEIVLSRSHPGMLRRMFELEVPEIFAGSVEIKAIAREASERSKVAVWAKEEGIDPVGACIGQRGTRIQTIIAELSGEKIDIIQWDDDQARYIANALSPARVMAVDINEREKRAVAHVEEHQLSLAIGKRGQNVRLAAKLTGWRIDVVKAGEDPASLVEQEVSEEKAAGATADDKPVKEDKLAEVEEKLADIADDPTSPRLPASAKTTAGRRGAGTVSDLSVSASEIADDTVQTDEEPVVSEGTIEAAMDPAVKAEHEDTAKTEKKE